MKKRSKLEGVEEKETSWETERKSEDRFAQT